MLGSLGAKMKSFLNAGSAEDTAQRDSQQKDTTGKDTTGKDSLQKQPSAAASPQVATSTQQQPSVADSAPDPSVESAQGPEGTVFLCFLILNQDLFHTSTPFQSIELSRLCKAPRI